MSNDRIDRTRLTDARETVTFMCSRIQPDGFLLPPEALFCETTGYQSEAAATIALAGNKLDMPEVFEPAGRMLNRLIERRSSSHLWSLDWTGGFPTRDPLPRNWEETNAIADARYTAATLLSLAIYSKATRDNSFVEPALASMAAMFNEWDFMNEDFIHITREYVALCVLAWGEPMAGFRPGIEPLVQWVRDTMLETAPRDFPFLMAIRTMLLLAADGPACVGPLLAPALERFLAEPSWRFAGRPDHFRHIRQTDDHISTRGNTAVALTFRVLDLVCGTTEYTSRPLYAHLSCWIDSMRNPDGGYVECEDIQTGRKWGQGSPAHFFPLWWILGGFQI